jgi:hypothetical protein
MGKTQWAGVLLLRNLSRVPAPFSQLKTFKGRVCNFQRLFPSKQPNHPIVFGVHFFYGSILN